MNGNQKKGCEWNGIETLKSKMAQAMIGCIIVGYSPSLIVIKHFFQSHKLLRILVAITAVTATTVLVAVNGC